jgi:hypothetical protein
MDFNGKKNKTRGKGSLQDYEESRRMEVVMVASCYL